MNEISYTPTFIIEPLKDLVRSSVEESLNVLVDKEADELVNAKKYERSSERQGYRPDIVSEIFIQQQEK